MPATESNEQQHKPHAVAAGVSMRELLASCAAASAVSTPPRLPDPEPSGSPAEYRDHRPSGHGDSRPSGHRDSRPSGHREAA